MNSNWMRGYGGPPPEPVIVVGEDSVCVNRNSASCPCPYKESHFASWNLQFLQRKVTAHMGSMRDFTEF